MSTVFRRAGYVFLFSSCPAVCAEYVGRQAYGVDQIIQPVVAQSRIILELSDRLDHAGIP